jgi:hypothetical protein
VGDSVKARCGLRDRHSYKDFGAVELAGAID